MDKTKFNYDYSKILWMKMFLAKPDYENNTSDVLINFEQALEIIKSIDNITAKETSISAMFRLRMKKYRSASKQDRLQRLKEYSDVIRFEGEV